MYKNRATDGYLERTLIPLLIDKEKNGIKF